MTILFYDKDLNQRTYSGNLAPLSVIITDSSDTVPEAQLIVSDEYKNIIELNGYFVIVGKEQVYQITDITAEYGTTTQYTVTGKEVTALIFSRRIALFDTMQADDTKQILIEDWIDSIFNYSSDGATVYPAFWDNAGNVFVSFKAPENKYYGCASIWDKGESLLDYIIDERDTYNCAVNFASSIVTINNAKTLQISVSLHPANKTQPIFLPSDKIESISITQSNAEFTELDYDIDLYPYGTNTSLEYTGRITADLEYDTPYMTPYTVAHRRHIVNVTQDAGSPDSPSDMTLEAILKRAFGKTSNEQVISGDRNYIYYKAGDTGAAIIYCYSRQAAEYIVNWYKENPANGAMDGETITATMPATKAYIDINGIARYCYRVSLAIKTSKATHSGCICIANTPNTVNPVTNCQYLYPITLAAVEAKLVKTLPPAITKTIDVTFTDTATANLGDKLVIHAGSTIVSGIVSSVTKTYEAGTETIDIEVKEWEAV